MKLQFGSEPTIEAYELLCRERDELLAKHNACDNELTSAKEVSERWLGEYIQRQREAQQQYEAIKSEISELKAELKDKEFDLAEVVDDGVAYRASCDNEFREYYDDESLSTDDKLALLKSDVKELAKEKAASAEGAALSEMLSDVHNLSVKITGYQNASPITSEMVSEGLRGIKVLDVEAKAAFSDYDNRSSDLRVAIDECWSLAKELAEMCPKEFKPKKRSDFSNNLGSKIKEACDNGG